MTDRAHKAAQDAAREIDAKVLRFETREIEARPVEWLAAIITRHYEAAEQGWISVEDEMPPDTRLVNVALCGTAVGTGHYNHGKKLWRKYLSFKETYEGVTHWRLLPAPPVTPKESR